MFSKIVLTLLSVSAVAAEWCDNSQYPQGEYFPTNSCDKYFECDLSVLTEHTCPQDQVFNPISKLCDLPENVPECSCFYTNFERTSLYGQFCENYLQCGVWQTCPQDQSFNPETMECDWHHNVVGCECGDAPKTKHATDCTKYYYCGTLYDCPNNTLFRIISAKCSNIQLVLDEQPECEPNCMDTVIESTTLTVTTTSTTTATETSTSTIYTTTTVFAG